MEYAHDESSEMKFSLDVIDLESMEGRIPMAERQSGKLKSSGNTVTVSVSEYQIEKAGRLSYGNMAFWEGESEDIAIRFVEKKYIALRPKPKKNNYIQSTELTKDLKEKGLRPCGRVRFAKTDELHGHNIPIFDLTLV